MGNKERALICTDDITPGMIRKYWHVWSLLKSNHPGLKLNAFVIPHYQENDDEFILKDEFIDWYDSVKHWVTLHLHGYAHMFPPEYLLNYDDQRFLIEKGARMLGKITKRTFGIKAPGYKFNPDTVKIASELCLDFFALEESFYALKKQFAEKTLPVKILNTHTNGISGDSIEKIYNFVNEFLLTKDCLLIEELFR